MKAVHTGTRTLALVSAFIAFSVSALGQSMRATQGPAQRDRTELDNFFRKTLETQRFVGLGACLIKGDEIVWDGYYGYSDLEQRTPLNREDIFPLASLSKTVTATALMQLYERGSFKLDDDINDFMPIKVRNPNFPDKPITFRMLLTHTGSLEDVTSTGLKTPKGVPYPHGVTGDSNIPLREFVEDLFTPGGKYYSAEYFSKSEPGTKYSYSNFAFSLIGYLVEKIAKEDFSEYCKEHIFRPLGMDNTGWHLRDLDTTRVIFGYGFPANDSSTSYRKVLPFGEPGYPSGNLRTTMHDFARFASAFINKGRYKEYQLLKPQTVELMLTPQGIKNIPSRAFRMIDIGLAWLINDVEGVPLYTMNGFSGSIFTNAYFSVETGTAFMYYFTGITMKNMFAMVDITKKLHQSVKAIE